MKKKDYFKEKISLIKKKFKSIKKERETESINEKNDQHQTQHLQHTPKLLNKTIINIVLSPLMIYFQVNTILQKYPLYSLDHRHLHQNHCPKCCKK